MKWLTARYAYPLVVLSLFASIALQVAWLEQLYQSQQRQLRQEIEELVSTASVKTAYHTIVQGHEQSVRFREFFLSPEWLRLRQAFDDLKVDDLHSEFHYGLTNDSSSIQIKLSFLNSNHKAKPHASHVVDRLSPVAALNLDRKTFQIMDSTVRSALVMAGIFATPYLARYNYSTDQLDSTNLASTGMRTAYASRRYAYNLKFLHKYQLLLPALTSVIFYRMRFYLFSSLLLILLTGIAFYFVLRLMHNQRSYAQAKQTFVSNMTHELKTPVATVSIALESLASQDLASRPDVLKNYLAISRSELHRLNLMIEKVLNLEQVDTNQVSFRKEWFDVQQGVEDVLASMKLQAEHRAATITFQPAAIPCFVSGDPAHLTNVFYNLVDNSLKYGGKGVQMTIRAVCQADKAVIEFLDNGPGIAPVHRKRVFERFFRVPDLTANTHNVKGSGLGLNYAQQVVRQHGGTIELKTDVNQGCTFIITLPLAT